jgi:hypothetical protein
VAHFVQNTTTALDRLEARAGRSGSDRLGRNVVAEAFSIATAFVDADGNHTDAELWAILSAFAGRLDTITGLTAPDDLRRAELIAGRRAWIEKPSEMLDLVAAADGRFNTGDAWRYYTDAMDLAYAVCATDRQPSPSELDAVERFRTVLLSTLERHQVVRPDTGAAVHTTTSPAEAAKPDAPAEDKPRPLEELLAELDGLVGLRDVKAEVKLVANMIKVQTLRREHHLPVVEQSRHLVFTGNPGTGKTTVARLLAQIYRTLGVVEHGQLVETDRVGLVAGYVGQTATKTAEVFKRALGGVLLVDEAYALARGNENDFGQEAIDTLVKLIEDHRDEVVVIAAGYTDEMAEFIDSNPGLSSRFPKTIHFPDYSNDELVAIFRSLCDKNAYNMSPETEATVRSWFEGQPRDKGFGNGRLARNLFEAAITRQASRVVDIKTPTDAELCGLEPGDIAS